MDKYLRDLLATMTGEKGMERKKAREIVVLTGDSAAPEVRALLGSADKRTRWEAAKALGAMVDADSVYALVALLHDPESDIRWLAADALINLGPRSVGPLLESLLAAPTEKGQAQMAGRVLRSLAEGNSVLAAIVADLSEVLGDPDPGVVEPRVSRALAELRSVTGVLPREL